MIRLEVVAEGQTRYFSVEAGVSTIGSAPDNDLVIACSGVSRHHATVERSGESITIKDAASKNGVVVAGRRVPAVTLTMDTNVMLGRACIRLSEVDPGDVALALVFEAIDAGDNAALDRLTETVSTTSEVAGGIVRWVRSAQQGTRHRSALFAEAQAILGATTLMIVKGGAVIDEIAGPKPTPEAFRDFYSAAPVYWIVCEPAESIRIGAHYPEGPSSSRWRLEFLGYVAEELEALPVAAPEEVYQDLVFPADIVRGTSAVMASVYEQVEQAVRSEANVLLLGESGSGKDVIARLIHESDRSRMGRFVVVNTAAMPASLLEAELFGVVAGAATDVKERPGAFRSADRGTILLDEIGDMAPELQAKLLRVVEDRAVTPLGSSDPEPINVRIISATNRNLQELVGGGTFRMDLYFRLNAITITVPPLRARRADLSGLVSAMIQSASRRHKKRVKGLSTDALHALDEYSWPGNVRELGHVIDRAVLACPSAGTIETRHVVPHFQVTLDAVSKSGTLEERRAAAEATGIEEALRITGNNKTRAADLLGISRQALHNRLNKLRKKR